MNYKVGKIHNQNRVRGPWILNIVIVTHLNKTVTKLM